MRAHARNGRALARRNALRTDTRADARATITESLPVVLNCVSALLVMWAALSRHMGAAYVMCAVYVVKLRVMAIDAASVTDQRR